MWLGSQFAPPDQVKWVQGVSHKYCRRLQRGNGFGLKLMAPTRKEDENRGALSLPGLNAGVSRNV
jgi:hypothetical protein